MIEFIVGSDGVGSRVVGSCIRDNIVNRATPTGKFGKTDRIGTKSGGTTSKNRETSHYGTEPVKL